MSIIAIVKNNEMEIGDVVKLPLRETPFCHNMVIKIEEGLIHLRRPFVYSLGCTPEAELTSGVEDYCIYQDSDSEWELILGR